MTNNRKKGPARRRVGPDNKAAAGNVRRDRSDPRYNGTGSRLPRGDTSAAGSRGRTGPAAGRENSRYRTGNGVPDTYGDTRSGTRSVTRDRERQTSSAGGRRSGNGVYYISGENGRNREERRAEEKRRPMTEADRRRRLEEIRLRYQRRVRRFRAAVILAAAAAATVVLLFMTPIFDIKQIVLDGNNAVTKEQIQEKVGSLIGANLFASTSSGIRDKVMEIPMIEDVNVTKKLFPPSVRLEITESTPAAYMLSSNRTVVIDSNLTVLDDSGSLETEGIPSISGISVPSYEVNSTLVSDSAEKDEALRTMLSSFESTGLLGDITYISLDDMSEITFNYANRLECSCGSSLELDRKIRMFAETISSSSMENSMGTMDLSTPGYAVYLP